MFVIYAVTLIILTILYLNFALIQLIARPIYHYRLLLEAFLRTLQ